MRPISDNAIILCRMQGDLFANYSDFSPCSPLVFIRRFMFSRLAERFDDISVLCEISSIKTFCDEINEQYRPTAFGKSDSFSKEALYWTGYMYRYWAYRYEISSSELYRHVKPKMLLERYYLYHSQDPEYVIERISEEEKIELPPKKRIEDILKEYIKFVESENKK